MQRFEAQLRDTTAEFRLLIGRIPRQSTPPLPADWLRCEMLERSTVLGRAPVRPGSTILEVGAGPHAIATVPLAWMAGPEGRVVASEKARWGHFRDVIALSRLGDRIRPVTCDARRLPLRTDSVDLSVCIHGLRSLRGEAETVRVLREMFRVSPDVFLAESLPHARTDAQRAHLAMYELREEVFSAAWGKSEDLPYAPAERVASLVDTAGGVVEKTEVLEVDLPHALAYFPRSLIDAVPAGGLRESLRERWDRAEALRRRYGEDHPPVGIVHARRS